MLTKRPATDYAQVRLLFGDLLDFNLIVPAALAGSTPARLYADDALQHALLITCEGSFIAGDPGNEDFAAALRDLFAQLLADGFEAFYLEMFPAGWEDRLSSLLGGPIWRIPRLHYLCTELRYDWQRHVPAGYEVRPIDGDLLENLPIPEHITGWIASNWGDAPTFLANGFGFCTVHAGQIVSWSLADCIWGDACEIGIHTHPDYRRRGLAALTAAAAVNHAFDRGLKVVGWHCNVDNAGSIGTALKVGFEKERDYTHHVYFDKPYEET